MSGVIKLHSVHSEENPSVRPIDLSFVYESRSMDSGTAVADPVAAAEEARAVVEAAEREAETIRQQAYEEGMRAGAAAASEIATALIERLESGIRQLDEDKDALADSVEQDVLKLCLEIVEKLIRHEVKTEPRIVVRVIKSCLRRIKDSGEIYIRVSPSELEQVRAARDELTGLAQGARSLTIVDDRRVTAGGCVVESASGDYDARLETQLESISKKLTETFEDDRSTGPGHEEVLPSDQQA